MTTTVGETHRAAKEEYAMADINYGVVEQDGSWIIIGANLRYGSYPTREEAEDAARRGDCRGDSGPGAGRARAPCS